MFRVGELFTITKHGNKYSLKGGKTGKWCADDAHTVQCNRPHVRGWELFTIEPAT